jgi:hypothetical protein
MILCLEMLDGLHMHFNFVFDYTYTLLIIFFIVLHKFNMVKMLHGMLVFFFVVCDFSLTLYFLNWKHTHTRKIEPNTRIQVVILPSSTLTYMC